MNYLLDTHIALWALADSDKLPKLVLDILDDKNNNIYISIISVLEISIKNKIKPEQMPINEMDFVKYSNKLGYIMLPLKLEHIYFTRDLKRKDGCGQHKDPFDRLLLSQSLYEDMLLITHDDNISMYENGSVLLV